MNRLGIKAGKAASMQVVVVPSIQSDTDEFSIADYVIHSFLDFQPELWGLPPFDDRMFLSYDVINPFYTSQLHYIYR